MAGSKDADAFLWYKLGDKKRAAELGAKEPLELLFFDCDLEPIHRAMATGGVDGIESALSEALDNYPSKEISWGEYGEEAIDALKGSDRMVLLAFVNEKEESQTLLKNLEDRSLSKRHGSILFQRIPYARDEISKKYLVNSAPTLVAVDPDSKTSNRVIEKLSGKTNVPSLLAFVRKTLAKVDKSGSKTGRR